MQRDLADILSVSNSTISHWEKGRRLPSISELQRIADFFNVSLSDFRTTGAGIEPTDSISSAQVPTKTLDLRPIGFEFNYSFLGLHASGILVSLIALFTRDVWNIVHVVVGIALSLAAVILYLLNGFSRWNSTVQKINAPLFQTFVFRHRFEKDRFNAWKRRFLLWIFGSGLLTIAAYGMLVLSTLLDGEPTWALMMSLAGLIAGIIVHHRFRVIQKSPVMDRRIDYQGAPKGLKHPVLFIAAMADFIGVVSVILVRILVIDDTMFNAVYVIGLILGALCAISSYAMMLVWQDHIKGYALYIVSDAGKESKLT